MPRRVPPRPASARSRVRCRRADRGRPAGRRRRARRAAIPAPRRRPARRSTSPRAPASRSPSKDAGRAGAPLHAARGDHSRRRSRYGRSLQRRAADPLEPRSRFVHRSAGEDELENARPVAWVVRFSQPRSGSVRLRRCFGVCGFSRPRDQLLVRIGGPPRSCAVPACRRTGRALIRRPRRGVQAGAPGGQIARRSRGTPSSARPRRVGRRHDHGVRAMRVTRGKRRVVAPDLRRPPRCERKFKS